MTEGRGLGIIDFIFVIILSRRDGVKMRIGIIRVGIGWVMWGVILWWVILDELEIFMEA